MGAEDELLAEVESSEEEQTFVQPSKPFNPFDMVRIAAKKVNVPILN